MRQLPELEFRDDRSMEHAEQIDRALRNLNEVEKVGSRGVEEKHRPTSRLLDSSTARLVDSEAGE
jgi:hypothetical protein